MRLDDFKERKRHGTEDFPIQYYFVNENHEQYVMPLHWHPELEVIRIVTGSLTLYVNNTEYGMSAGDVAIVSSGSLHRADPHGCTYECAVFDTSVASGYNSTRVFDMMRPIISSDAEIAPLCPYASKIICELMDTLSRENDYYELRVSSLISELVHALYVAGAIEPMKADGERVSHRRAAIELLIDKIEREYSHRLSLGELAETVGMNEKYMCRFFKEFTGITPLDYVNRVRIDHACHNMTVGRMNVTEAAFECGFNELSYFSKVFKKYKGMSPGQYRRRYGLHDVSGA